MATEICCLDEGQSDLPMPGTSDGWNSWGGCLLSLSHYIVSHPEESLTRRTHLNLRDPRGLEKKLQRSFQTKTQNTTQCHAGLIVLVKVNPKIGPDSRGGNRLHLCMERVGRGGPSLGMGKILVAVFANNSPYIPRFNLVLSDPLGFSWNRHSLCCGNFVQ